MDFNDFADQYSRLAPHLIAIDGVVFTSALGAQWAEEHERVPFLVTPDELAMVTEGSGLEPRILARVIERYMADLRAFHDHSEQCTWIRHTYRDILPIVRPAIFRDLDELMRGGANTTDDRVRAALTMLCLWPGDVRHDPDAWMVWLVAGSSLQQLGDEHAESFLGQSIQLNPNCASALVELGVVKARKNRASEAAALFDRALQEEPDNVSALSNAAASRLQAGRIEEALRLLRKAKLLEPDDPSIDKLLHIAQQKSRP